MAGQDAVRSRYYWTALEKGRLEEAIQLAWYSIQSRRTCGREAKWLAEVLAVYEDNDGLNLLRSRCEERAGRDPRYQPPFRRKLGEDGNTDLIKMIELGVKNGEPTRRVLDFVREHPGVTRAELYASFPVFDDYRAKQRANKGKPKAVRIGKEWIKTHEFERILASVYFDSVEGRAESQQQTTFQARAFSASDLRPSSNFEPPGRSAELPPGTSQQAGKTGCAVVLLTVPTLLFLIRII